MHILSPCTENILQEETGTDRPSIDCLMKSFDVAIMLLVAKGERTQTMRYPREARPGTSRHNVSSYELSRN